MVIHEKCGPQELQTGSFSQYATWYDNFNDEKDYQAESKYILDNVVRWKDSTNTWLDVGCGTGKHLAYFKSQGVSVEGVDSSPFMISRARESYPETSFHISTAENFNLLKGWDVISMLFHVLSYHIDESEIRKTLKNVSDHLDDQGIFIFDFWHTPGLINDPPTVRARKKVINGRTLFRIAIPKEDRSKNRVDILYQFRWDSEDGPVVHQENHSMRHFTVEELESFLEDAGMRVLQCNGWMTTLSPSSNDWFGLILAKKFQR